MEHFQNPDEEFQLLYELPEQNGTLICMAHLYDPSIDFQRWYYKNDRHISSSIKKKPLIA
jgi:hypothetical protein